MRTLVAVILLVASLAGCAEPTFLPVESQGDPAVGNNTAPPPPVDTDGNVTVNTPPVALLNATLINGTIPLNVTFHLNGTDADGDNLTWVLSLAPVGDGTNATVLANGTQLPASVTYIFLEAGNFTVALVVSDGHDEAVTLTLVTALEIGDPNAGLPPPTTISGTVSPAVHVEGICFTSYSTYGPEIWGWQYSMPSGWVTEWWQGESDFVAGGSTGTVPPDTDNVGACRSDTVAVGSGTSWTITVKHPDWVDPA